jgi:hypothetical protein
MLANLLFIKTLTFNFMKYNHDEKVVDAVMAVMAFLWILFGACMIGLTLTILKVILAFLGIENNL